MAQLENCGGQFFKLMHILPSEMLPVEADSRRIGKFTERVSPKGFRCPRKESPVRCAELPG